MCQNTFDDHYAAYGGSQPRAEMTYGRVGSRFSTPQMPEDYLPPEPGIIPPEPRTDSPPAEAPSPDDSLTGSPG
jgi:hypothetical protein